MSRTVRRWGLVWLLALGCLLLGVLPEDKEGVVAIRRGDALALERQYGAALDAYGLAAVLCPGCSHPHLDRGKVYVAQGRYEEAWKATLTAIRLGGNSDETMEVMAQLYLAQGAPELAVGVLTRLLERRSKRADLWLQLAEAYLAAGDGVSAREAFAQALEMGLSDGQSQRVYAKMGMLCIIEAGVDGAVVDEAVDHFQKMARGPDLELVEHAGAFLTALYRVKQGDEPALARAKLGQALLEYGDMAVARQQFQAAVDMEPAFVDGHAYLGYVLSLLGEAELAVHHLEQAIVLEPAYPLPHYFLGMHYARQGWWITARDVLVQAHDLDPSNPAICAAVAETYIRAQDPVYAVAERWLHVAVSNAPQDVRFHLLLAHFYVDYGIDPGGRGVAVARVAVNLAPENSEAHETLGWGYHLSGHPDLALEPLAQACVLAPQKPRLYYRLGQVYQALGRRKEAIASYQRAVDLDWNGSVGEKARWSLEADQGLGPNSLVPMRTTLAPSWIATR